MQVKALKSPYALTPEAARRQLIEVFGAFVESICRCSGGEWGKVLADQWSSLRKQLEPQFNVTGVTRFFQALNRPSSLKLEGLGCSSSIGVGSILSFYPASNSSRGMMPLGSTYLSENNHHDFDPQQQSDLTSEAMNAFLDPHLTQPSLGQIQQNIEALKQSYGSIGNDNHDCLSSINGGIGNSNDNNNCASMSQEINSNQQQVSLQCESSSAKNNSNSNQIIPDTQKQSSSTVLKGASKKTSQANKLSINSNQAQSSVEPLLSPSEILRRNKKDRNTKINRALSPQLGQSTLAKATSPVRKNTKVPYEKNEYFFTEQKLSAPQQQAQGNLGDKLSSRSINRQEESQQEDTVIDATVLADDGNPAIQSSQPVANCMAATETAHEENVINENNEVENVQQVEKEGKCIEQDAAKAKIVSEPLKSQQQSQGRLKSKGRDVAHFGLKGITNSITSSLGKTKSRMLGPADKENNNDDSGYHQKKSFKSFSQYKQSSKSGETQFFGLHSRYNNNHHLSSNQTVQINLSHNRPHNIGADDDATMAV